jgi:hydroxymethylpyrimidine pyrophosphatase-like HAD family hydrolase
VKTVCFDLDGVLASYKEWPEDGSIGDPLPAGVKLLKLCKEAGYKTVLSTCRTHPCHGIENQVKQAHLITAWLRENGLRGLIDEIDDEGKPIADVYIDDRGLRFDQRAGSLESYGDWLFNGFIKQKETKP